MTYPAWSYFPRNRHAPDWVPEFLKVVSDVEVDIGTAAQRERAERVLSDDVLAALRPGLQGLGFAVESGKTKSQKISRPVLFGDDGVPQVSYEIDAFHDERGIAVEVEAGRGASNNADYRDILRSSLLLDAHFLALLMPVAYHFTTSGRAMSTPAFAHSRRQLEAIYASQRLRLPFEGVLLVGY